MAGKSTRKAIAIVAVITMALAGSLIAESASQSRVLRIDGSTTVGPIADAFTEAFGRSNPDLSITVNKTGSGKGALALIEGRAEIATMSRFMKDKEFKAAVEKGIMPVAHVVAMDGVCVVVHPSNPVGALTSEQIKKIFLGEYTNWSQLGGPNMDIVAISRDTSSGTYETFHKLVMKKADMGSSVDYVNSNAQAHARVKTTKGAIAYVGLGFVDSSVKALTVDGVSPSRRTIAGGEYPISRPLFMFTNGYPKMGSDIFKFVTFHLSERGQEIIEAKGFVPVTDY